MPSHMTIRELSRLPHIIGPAHKAKTSAELIGPMEHVDTIGWMLVM